MKIDKFQELRQKVIDAGYSEEIIWSESLKPCDNADLFFREYMWVVLSAGMKNQIARIIEKKIYKAIENNQPIGSVFGHRGKVEAIEKVMKDKQFYFDMYQKADDKLEYLKSLLWIGDITKYHLAKNLGLDIAKPDRHLVRIAQKENTDCFSLCKNLAIETGYRVATVDVIIWRAANLGYI